MVQQHLSDVYTKFKVHFYREMFARINSRETSLTTTELFCVEVIYALKEPTVNEFARYINVSSPNAAYKVNSLIKKGYIEKTQSESDHREYHLRVTKKYHDYADLSQKYVNLVSERIKEHFSETEIEIFDRILSEISGELMPEVDIPSVDM